MKITHIIAGALASSACLISSAHAATTIDLQDVSAARVQDHTTENNTGDSVAENFLFVGGVDTVDFHPVYVFQMIGAGLGANITDAQLSISQTNTQPHDFDEVDAYVLRTNSSATINVSDYQLTGTKLMDAYGGAAGNGLKTLDTAGKSTLTAYLVANWVENEYVFVTLRGGDTTIPYTDTGANNGYIFGNSSGGWTAGSTDAKLTVVAVPEPSSAALLGLGGLALILRRRK